MVSILLHTLGCKLNQLESEAFADTFGQAGFVLHDASAKTPPSIVIINTCTVTSKADQKARRVIRKALRDYPNSAVIVTGCYARLDKSEIEKLENGKNKRLFVLKGKEKLLDLPAFFTEGDDVCEVVRRWYEEGGENFSHGGREDIEPKVRENTEEFYERAFQFAPEKFSDHTRSFLKIQDGCDNHCTYCRIRLARGHSVSLSAERVLERLKILEQNHAEAVLTGVNICQYHDKMSGNNLTGLLEYLLAGTQKISLRLSSLEPEYIDENFAKVISHERIRPHFHLSIQSCSKKILEKMGRSYNGRTIEKAVSLLRSVKDDPFIACDIITGFPGETQTEFNETYELCKKTGFAWMHVFPYSKRPGTPAFSFTGAVQEKEVTKRVQLLTDLAWQGRADYIRRWLGRDVEVLTEKSDGRFCRGISENYLKLLVQYKGKKPPPGAVLRCKLAKKGDNKGDFDAVAHF